MDATAQNTISANDCCVNTLNVMPPITLPSLINANEWCLLREREREREREGGGGGGGERGGEKERGEGEREGGGRELEYYCELVILYSPIKHNSSDVFHGHSRQLPRKDSLQLQYPQQVTVRRLTGQRLMQYLKTNNAFLLFFLGCVVTRFLIIEEARLRAAMVTVHL